MAASKIPAYGEPAPWFVARCTSNERYHSNTVAGRCIVLTFLGSAAHPYSRAAVAAFLLHSERFDDTHASFFGVSVDPADERERRLEQMLPGYRYIWDYDRQVSAAYGVVSPDGRYAGCTFVLDRALRVLAVVPFDTSLSPEAHVARIMEIVGAQPTGDADVLAGVHAPVLVVPRVFEPAFCNTLIAHYQNGQVEKSGFMRERNGKTVAVFDDAFKRRSDCSVEHPALRQACRVRLTRRLTPEVQKAFQFTPTHAERYIVSCYSSAEGGYFRPHRDNTTKGTAHRRFAVTINLNTGEYEGGLLRFPEFGRQLYEAPLGGAIVFSCSLLHEATDVTRGVRYAFLPFLYDEAGAALREANLSYVDLQQGGTDERRVGLDAPAG